MTPLSGTVDMLASLQQRVAALEQQLGSDSLQPNVLTVAADGTIGAEFSGHVDAKGIVIPLGGTEGALTNSIAWHDTAGDESGLIESYLSAGLYQLRLAEAGLAGAPAEILLVASLLSNLGKQSSAEVQLLSGSDSGTDADTAIVANATAQDGTGHPATVIDATGASSFLQLLSPQNLQLALGSGTVSVPAGWSNNAVNFHAALPQVANMFPFYALEPFGVAHSIVSSEIGAFTTAGITVNVNSSGAQNVGIYVFAVGGP